MSCDKQVLRNSIYMYNNYHATVAEVFCIDARILEGLGQGVKAAACDILKTCCLRSRRLAARSSQHAAHGEEEENRQALVEQIGGRVRHHYRQHARRGRDAARLVPGFALGRASMAIAPAPVLVLAGLLRATRKSWEESVPRMRIDPK